MLRLIEKASTFIYIENQFFVSAFGEQVPPPSPDLSPAAQFINTYYGSDQNASARKAGWFDADKRWFSADLKELTAPPQNAICRALIQRIRRAIFDCTKPDFHVYITLPVHPEGELAKASVAVQVYWTMQSLVHGSHSLINGIPPCAGGAGHAGQEPPLPTARGAALGRPTAGQ
jgi:phospholipase D1/2